MGEISGAEGGHCHLPAPPRPTLEKPHGVPQRAGSVGSGHQSPRAAARARPGPAPALESLPRDKAEVG